MWQFHIVAYKNRKQASVRTQGRAACFPPTLLNVNIQKVLKKLREKLTQKTEVKIQDERTDMLQFVNDIAVLTHSEKNLMEVLGEVCNILTTWIFTPTFTTSTVGYSIGISLMSPYLEQYASTSIQYVCSGHLPISSVVFLFSFCIPRPSNLI